MGNNRVVCWKLILIVSVAGIIIFAGVMIAIFHEQIYFDFHFRVTQNEYGEYELTEIKHTHGKVLHLPEKTPDGNPITILCHFWKKDYPSKITELIIPDSYQQIREGVGDGLDNLQSVMFGAGIETIYGGLFSESKQLDQLTVSIENPKFYSDSNCVLDKSTKTVVLGCRASIIPTDAVALGEAAFANVSNLKQIEIPTSVNLIQSSCFYRCDNLQAVVIPSTVLRIEQFAFASCKNLTLFCERSEKPAEWDQRWTSPNTKVIWNFSNTVTENSRKVFDVVEVI